MWKHAVLGVVALAVVSGVAYAAFPETPPNDPGYASQYGLKGHINRQKYPLAQDAAGASGMSVDEAWADTKDWGKASTGRTDVVIAYIEGGINYNAGSQQELIPKVYLNRAEIESSANYDPRQYKDNGDPWYNALDFGKADANVPYIARPRKHGVPDANGNGYIDPEDLIVFYSDGVDDDHNGYVDDISGWDFYNNQNNPSSGDVTYGHSNSQMRAAAALTNNANASAGACPRCMLLPVRGGDEALDTPDDLAQAFIFAVDSGAKVITSLTADLGYNTYMRAAQEYAWKHNVLVAESTNDFDSTDHQGGMYWAHAIGGNGVIRNTAGLDTITGLLSLSLPLNLSTIPTYTFRQRSGQTSWGPKNIVSVAGTTSTSASTGTLGGLLGLMYSYALKAYDRGYVDHRLSASEILQTMTRTADDITPSDYAPFVSNVPLLGDLVGGILRQTPLVDVPVVEPWPVREGWDLQTGYGRINVKAFQNALENGDVPPGVWFDRPQWFSVYDPQRSASVSIYGHIDPAPSASVNWTLAYGLGGEPQQWTQIASGSGARAGKLGSLDLARIPKSFYTAPFHISKRKTLETTEQYTVTLRLRATDSDGEMGEERRAIQVVHDDSWMDGFPRRIRPRSQCSDATVYCYSPGGDGQPALVDLAGLGHLQIVFGDTDGRVHAIDPLTGKELPGFPVSTDATQVTKPHAGIDPQHEPLANNVSVGDLDHDGNLWIVATSNADGKLYVWNQYGQLRDGFPIQVATGVKPLASPRVPRKYYRGPHKGAFASPILYDWNGDGTLEIIQAGWDGHIHVYYNDGRGELPGFPVEVLLPDSYTPASGDIVIQDHKIDSNPVIANLDADPEPEIVVRTQFSDTSGAGIQVLEGTGHLLAYDNDGSLLPGWPVDMSGIAFYYGSAQEFITEGSNSPVAADIDGDGEDEVASTPVFSANVYVFNGDGSRAKTYTSLPSIKLDPAFPLVDIPLSFTTTGAFGHFGPGGRLTYAQSGSTALSVITGLLTSGLGLPIKNREMAFDAKTGLAVIPGFPAKRQGLDFLGAPLFVDVTGDGKAEIVDGGDSSAIQAYTALGQQAPGFPKFMSGWTLWSPSAGDLDSDGTVELVANTREGYTFVWHTPGKAAANTEWWHYHHDEWNTGNYGVDSRPPGILRNPSVDRDARRVVFTAPGDNWYAGEPAYYLVLLANGDYRKLPATVAAGETQALSIPAGMNRFTLRAVDAAGNLGRPVQVSMQDAVVQDAGGIGAQSVNAGNGTGGAGGGCTLGSGNDAGLPLLLLLALCMVWGRRRYRLHHLRG